MIYTTGFNVKEDKTKLYVVLNFYLKSYLIG